MPITKDTLGKHLNPTFIETGTYLGEASAAAKALGFGSIHTMDISEAYARNGAEHGAQWYCGDSPEILARILPGISGAITFWLDAHPLVTPMTLFETRFPLARELLAIKRTAGPGAHTILIDDLRTFPLVELDILTHMITVLWPGCQISREAGICPADILCVKLL